jgi:hypothetical protein
MDKKTYKRKNKLSAIVKDNKGIEDRALLLIMLSVLLFVVIGIIMQALQSVSGTVDKAGKVANATMDSYAKKYLLGEDTATASPSATP